MEFWSGILGAVVGGAIALIGTIFSSVYTHRCQRENEQHQEKKRIYVDVCGILSGMNTVEVVVEPREDQLPVGKIDTANFCRTLDELSTYMTNYAGEITLYLPNEIYSALMRIRGDMYQLASHEFSNFDTDASIQKFGDDFKFVKTINLKIYDLQNKIKNDLYPTNRKKKKGCKK